MSQIIVQWMNPETVDNSESNQPLAILQRAEKYKARIAIHTTILANFARELKRWRPLDHDVIVDESSLRFLSESPMFIVEILLPWMTMGEYHEKVKSHLNAGVRLIWFIHPTQQTVTIFRPNQRIDFVNASQELDGGDVLPGFRVPVKRFFE